MTTADAYLERFFRGVLSSRAFASFEAEGGGPTAVTTTALADAGLSADFWRRARLVRITKGSTDADFERVVTETVPSEFSATHGGVAYVDVTPAGDTCWLVRLPAGWGIHTVYDLLNQALERCFEWDSLPVTAVPDGDMRDPSPDFWNQIGGGATFVKDATVTFRNRQSLHVAALNDTGDFVQSDNVSAWPGEPFYFELTFENRGSGEPAVGVWNVDASAWISGFPLGAGLATNRRVVTARFAFNVPANCYNLVVRFGGEDAELYVHEAVLRSQMSSDLPVPESLRSVNQARRLVRLSPGDSVLTNIVLADSRVPVEVVHPAVDVMSSYGDAARLKLGRRMGSEAWRLEFARPYRVPGLDAAIEGEGTSKCPLEYAVASMAELFYKIKAAPENGSDELVNSGARDYWRMEFAKRALEFKPDVEQVQDAAYANMGTWGPG